MIVRQDPQVWYGKCVKEIRTAKHLDLPDLVMTETIEIVFDDESVLALGIDWRGAEAYISQYVPHDRDAVFPGMRPSLQKRVGQQSRDVTVRYKVTHADKS